MTLYVPRVVTPHICDKPQVSHAEGAVFRCNACGRHYVIRRLYGGSKYWHSVSAFKGRRLIKKIVRGHGYET